MKPPPRVDSDARRRRPPRVASGTLAFLGEASFDEPDEIPDRLQPLLVSGVEADAETILELDNQRQLFEGVELQIANQAGLSLHLGHGHVPPKLIADHLSHALQDLDLGHVRLTVRGGSTLPPSAE